MAAQFEFGINIVFGDGLTPSQQQAFSTAEATWESIVVDRQPGVFLGEIPITARAVAIDGMNGILARGGPTGFQFQGGFWYSTAGIMEFDSADIATLESDGSLLDVITHEMGHVLGIGTLWQSNNVYQSNTNEYTGQYGLAAYQEEFDPSATFIPVELGGGPGTAGSHWDEVDGGDELTGITDSMGNDMRNELMTGWLDTPTFISNTTVQSLRDIGFIVVPEPHGVLLVLIAGCFLTRMRRR